MSQSRSTAGPDSAEYKGPYENWIFNGGAAYNHPGLERKEEALSCVFEMPRSLRNTVALTYLRSNGMGLEFPVLWRQALFHPTFLPAVISDKAVTTVSGFEEFHERFPKFINQLLDDLNTSDRTPPNYRFNLPVRAKTLNADWREHQAGNPQPTPKSEPAERENIVIVAVIDDGVPFAHRNFTRNDKSGTRIDYCWSQSATDKGRCMLFGREFDQSTIDRLYEDCDGDEEAIYRETGLAGGSTSRLRFPLDKQYSHGAHVLDALAGNQPGTGDADQDRVHIIAVDLPAMSSVSKFRGVAHKHRLAQSTSKHLQTLGNSLYRRIISDSKLEESPSVCH